MYQIQANQIFYANELIALIEKQRNLNALPFYNESEKDKISKFIRVEFNQTVRNLMNTIKENDFSHD